MSYVGTSRLPIPEHIKKAAFAEIDRQWQPEYEKDAEKLLEMRRENQEKYDQDYARVIARCNRIQADCKRWKREAIERKYNQW